MVEDLEMKEVMGHYHDRSMEGLDNTSAFHCCMDCRAESQWEVGVWVKNACYATWTHNDLA